MWSVVCLFGVVCMVALSQHFGVQTIPLLPAIMSTRREDGRRRESPQRRRELSRRRPKRGRSESIWPAARRIRRAENDASVQVKILEDKNLGLANTISGLRAALDLKHVNIQNYKAKVERIEDRCEGLSGELSQATSRIANLEYHLKEKQHEENALRESIVVHAKSLLNLANLDEKPEIAVSERTIVSHSSSEQPPEVASLAEEQTRELADPIVENDEVDRNEDKREKSQVPPASPEIRPTEAAPGSPPYLTFDIEARNKSPIVTPSLSESSSSLSSSSSFESPLPSEFLIIGMQHFLALSSHWLRSDLHLNPRLQGFFFLLHLLAGFAGRFAGKTFIYLCVYCHFRMLWAIL